MKVKSKDKWKEIDIKKSTCYFDDIIKIQAFDLDKILIDEKSCEIILVYNISYKSLIDPKPLRVIFDNIDVFVRSYDGTRYLTLLGSKKYDFFYNSIRYVTSVKSGIRYVISHIYVKIKIDS